MGEPIRVCVKCASCKSPPCDAAEPAIIPYNTGPRSEETWVKSFETAADFVEWLRSIKVGVVLTWEQHHRGYWEATIYDDYIE